MPQIKMYALVFMMMMSTQAFGAQEIQKNISFLVYYGSDIETDDLKNIDVAILEPNHILARRFIASDTQFYAYISIGEIEKYRPEWKEFHQQSFVVEKNPEWPDNFRVDIRNSQWQNFILNQRIPEIIQKGYHGIFLDTIDTALYLESKDPQKYKGSKLALVKFIHQIKEKYPNLKIIPNNALEILDSIGLVIDGVVVEDLYTRYDFKNKKYGETPTQISQYKESFLDAFVLKFKKPVFNILYALNIQSKLAQNTIQLSKQKGYSWYLTQIELNKIGSALTK